MSSLGIQQIAKIKKEDPFEQLESDFQLEASGPSVLG
jgi:hypothetical protein